MFKKCIVLAFLIILGLSSCSHEEGYIGGMKVYISKHGNPNYFDSMDSAYDGSFKFDYLYTGTYDIWVFGDCDYCSWDQIYVLKTIEVNSKKATVETEDFVVSF